MQIARAVSRIGTQALIAGMGTHKLKNETKSDETWLSKDIVGELPKQHSGWKAWDRCQYGTLARDHCGITVTAQLRQQFPVLRQYYDVLIIIPGHNLRVAVVELKIVDEGRPWNAMVIDYAKIRKFQTFLRAQGSSIIVEGYIGGLVCDTYKSKSVLAEDTIATLEGNLPGLEVDPGTREPSTLADWGWRCVIAKMPGLP